MTFKFTPGKYKTRDGKDAVVLCDDAPGRWPLKGYIAITDDSVSYSWMRSGRIIEKHDDGADLMPPEPEQEPKTLFVTMDDAGNCLFQQTRFGEHAITGLPSVACTRVVLTPGRFDDENTPDDYTKGWNDALDMVIRSDYRDDSSLRAEKKETRP